jgi:hypothetical protein
VPTLARICWPIGVRRRKPSERRRRCTRSRTFRGSARRPAHSTRSRSTRRDRVSTLSAARSIGGAYCLLKIERCVGDELPITEDKIQYTRAEKDELLDMIHKGNKAQGGLTKVCDAFGVLGFVRFLQGYYLVIITKRRPIALIGRNRVYAIDEIGNLYVPPQDARSPSLTSTYGTEKRYKDLFFGLDLTKGFYFSSSYDLTHTMQHNMAASTRVNDDDDNNNSSSSSSAATNSNNSSRKSNVNKSTSDESAAADEDRALQFVWNAHLMRPVVRLGLSRWVLPVVSLRTQSVVSCYLFSFS